ncbi:hypothetical protein C943_01450 [Mariniradius saccharolyticus AK6]|uniref:Uncharacterized protein n=1 Tax=Mariniradius saccharolyticus AK6 TaxID=1239962 RepID=M7XC39_9BACT|nr:hypothetical protein C943_01450 [Mariniradius saccharolyticus AK6]
MRSGLSGEIKDPAEREPDWKVVSETKITVWAREDVFVIE